MIKYEKEGEKLRGFEEKDTSYLNLDRGINYDAIEDFPKVSFLYLLGKPEEWMEARLEADKQKNKTVGATREKN